MGVTHNFWEGKRVFVTGHTGFKGAWLCLLLEKLGAIVTGYALDPFGEDNLFELAHVAKFLHKDIRKNILDRNGLLSALEASNADIVIHMAAQAIVSQGYEDPIGTYEANVMGTLNLLDTLRLTQSVKAALVVTTDKCYENTGTNKGYTEEDRLGGHDPYSSSKACAELVTSSYRDSYFGKESSCNIATVRAGNVIGGGDFSENRIIPDCIRAYSQDRPVKLRSPDSIRPWQHVLDPLNGYLMLCESLFVDKSFAGAWNFGPKLNSNVTVGAIAQLIAGLWHGKKDSTIMNCDSSDFHEAKTLNLDSSKARNHIGFEAQWGIEEAIEKTVSWYKVVQKNECAEMATMNQIDEFLACQN